MITRLTHVSIRVRDLSEAIEFYAGRLGFRRMSNGSPRRDAPWVEMQPPQGGPTIALMPGRPASKADGPVLLFGTDDLEATCAELDRRDVCPSPAGYQSEHGGN